MANVKTRVRKSAPKSKVVIDQPKAAIQPKKGKVNLRLKRSKLLEKLKKALSFVFTPLGKLFQLIMPRYFINAWRELKQVSWPNSKETRRLTLAVFIFAIVFGTVVSIVDKGLDEFFKKVILK